jgi:3-oxoacyl-[acyl-carrier protein] reductase
MSDPGPVIIVTGAAQGIGACIAATLADEGATLVAADIQDERVQSVAADLRERGHRALGLQVDIADPESARAMADRVVSEFGRIDALVNNGGLDAQYGDPLEIDERHWRRLIDIDLSGQWWCTQAVLAQMVAQGRGRIVFISSSSVFVGGEGVSVAYCAAKSGLIGLTVGLSSQLEGHGILVNCVMPGPTGSTGTPMRDEDLGGYLAAHPLGFGGPQPVADAVRYLLGASGDWTSGAILNVSGGRLRGR